ncbi:pentapeptide repeat-containing protein [Trichocoleus sp. DQ-U1]
MSDVNLSEAILEKADLHWAYLSDANLSQANLSQANLSETKLTNANLSHTNLSLAKFTKADLRWADLSYANISNSDCGWADFSWANLSNADLCNAGLQGATLIGTNLENTNLAGCSVWGISAWDLNLDGANQSNLIISPSDSEPSITVEDLEVAQFIYLLLNNKKIRNVIDTVTSKVVLILGRFTDERLKVLNAIRNELRKHNYLPVLFDFEKPASRNITETVSTVAHLAHFVIADLTDPKALPQELQRIIPQLPSVPVQLILQSSIDKEYGMVWDFMEYDSVLKIYDYDNVEQLLTSFEEIIDLAENKIEELLEKKLKIQQEKLNRREKRV